MTDAERLATAGWQQTRTGRWTHTAFPGQGGRRRVFTTADAISLVDVQPDTPPRSPAELVRDAVTESQRVMSEIEQARRVQFNCDEGPIAS